MSYSQTCGMRGQVTLETGLLTIVASSLMLNTFKQDVVRYLDETPRSARTIFYAVFEMSLWAIAIFRFGKSVQRIRWWVIRWPLMLLYFFMYKFCEVITGIRISAESEIGAGLLIHNFGGIVLHGRIGENCTVVQGAQLISRADGRSRGWPTLGKNVYVGAGAKILGDVIIGNNVKIGANAVVATNVPDNSVVMPPECVVRARNPWKYRTPV